MKRAVILVGAGASLDFNVPSTSSLTSAIEREVNADPLMRHLGSDLAFATIKSGLAAYLKKPGVVNFEQIYHVAHELIFTYPPTAGAYDEFKPILQPFVQNMTGLSERALRGLCDKIVEVVFGEVSRACGSNILDLEQLAHFVANLSKDYVTRIYTTNYDDLLVRAAPEFYTGFRPGPARGPRSFDLDKFWKHEHTDCIFHLHGGVHIGFPPPNRPGSDIGGLFWFDDRDEALKHSSFSGSSPRRMDGTEVLRTAVITGLEKLSRLQQQPFSHFYAAMARDAMRADVIFVIGSGLSDLHLNTWLGEARARRPRPPLLFVDYWPNGFEEDTFFELDLKVIELFHALKVEVSDQVRGSRVGTGWTISHDRTAAVWDKGFQAFLDAPRELQEILSMLGEGLRSTLWRRLARRVHRWRRL
jgi:hypothetical protein